MERGVLIMVNTWYKLKPNIFLLSPGDHKPSCKDAVNTRKVKSSGDSAVTL